MTAACTRCGQPVPEILSVPPSGPDRWWRNQIRMSRSERVEVRHTMFFRIFTLRWLPENPADQLREDYTTLALCDRCAGDVFLFAQGKVPPTAAVEDTDDLIDTIEDALVTYDEQCQLFGTSGAGAYFLAKHLVDQGIRPMPT